MAPISPSVDLSRGQFAFTLIFHIIWPVFTIGMSSFLVAIEALWLKTGDADYYRHARFWAKLLLLNFGVGVATGLPLEFEFGTNWAPFSQLAGNFFGNILGFEGSMAFMLEAGFLGIMMFGWRRVAPAIHMFATCMVALGASMSALWIMSANSWMQTPTGGHVANGHFVVDNYLEAIFNPSAPWGITHMWVACLETTLFVIGGLSAWYILKDRHRAFFLRSFKIVVIAAIVITPVQIFLGDGSGRVVFDYQPAKGAAIEGHWETNPPGTPAPWSLLAWPNQAEQKNDWSIDIPYGLSLLATRTLTGQVKGLRDFPREDQPPLLPLLYYTFRLMVAIGTFFFCLMLWTVWSWRRGALTPEGAARHPALWRTWICAIPLGYIAVECGWTVREVGRQPWVIYGIMRTEHGASMLPTSTVATTLIIYGVIYAGLLVAFLYFARRILKTGPDVTMPIPPHRHTGLLDTRTAWEAGEGSVEKQP
ncbi:MAG TPA: cytochrome ubiquinol oxidase subunit I [Gammaproteobacteria bacterium]|jgi:cytochrome d ubiquinol oxidase subunit I|nr:cytochrome ubiquinol oxidase subunit I [Gammaproteobacteria bacterium]